MMMNTIKRLAALTLALVLLLSGAVLAEDAEETVIEKDGWHRIQGTSISSRTRKTGSGSMPPRTWRLR